MEDLPPDPSLTQGVDNEPVEIPDQEQFATPGLNGIGIYPQELGVSPYDDLQYATGPTDPDGQQDPTQDSTDDKLEQLEDRIEDVAAQIVLPPDTPLHIVNVATDGTWAEWFVVNGTISASGGTVGVDTLGWNGDTSSGAGLISLGATQSIVLEVTDGTVKRFVKFGGGGSTSSGNISLTYLTQVGGSDGDGTFPATWTYNLYSDAAKTILLASSQSQMMPRVTAASNTPATGGLYTVISGVTTLVWAFESYPLDVCTPTMGVA